MPEPEEQAEELLKDGSDICQQLMDRYARSSAPQHRHLLATAAAMRSILASESLPLTPPAYFAAAIDTAASNSDTLDSTAAAALLSFLSVVLPLVPAQEISAEKAGEAVSVLVNLVGKERGSDGGLAVATVKAVVKCLGILLGFCDLENWDSLKLGFQTLLDFSIDRRPKVRRCAQDCLVKAFKSFKSSGVNKAASKLVLSMLKNNMPLAVKLSSLKAVDGSKDDTLSKPEHLEVLYMLSVVKISVPSLSTKVSSKVISEIVKLLNSKFSVLTRHVFQVIEAFFETLRVEVTVPETEKIVDLLVSYVSSGDKNPVDTDISAATLLKRALNILHDRESSLWFRNLPLVCGCLAGLLSSEASIASLASSILKELLSHLADYKTLLTDKDKPSDDEGEISYVFMKSIVLKLADLMILANGGTSNTDHLRKCIGSAVIAMGPERILTLLPISLHADLTCLNIWLIPILKDYVVEASLGYYIENVVPLAKSFERASRKVKKLATSQDLQAHAHDLWGLLPGFCCHPTDTYQNVGALAEILITFLKEDSFMHKNIAIALQVLVYQNKNVLSPKTESAEPNSFAEKDCVLQFRNVPTYSKKIATKNIKALASCSAELLQALTNLFVDSLPEKRSYLKDAIGCLASITDSSITKMILMSLFERFQFVDGEGEFEKLGSDNQAMIDKEQGNLSSTEKEIQRCVIMELASSFVEGAKEDLIDLIYKYITHTFEVTNKSGHCEAYHTLSRILEEHAWFSSSRFVELIDLLLGLKSPVDIASLRSRFASLHILMIHALKMRLEEENTKAFLILNEVILTLKEGNEEFRKAAYDILLKISASLKDSSAISDAPYHKLIGMIMGYLSGSSPHIKSGAVSALSVLVYQDADICLSMPDIVPSLLSLLHTKVVEIIKAVLGFVKVLVSCLQAKDLHRLLSDVVYEVLPWSSVSRHHFRSKVIVIMEIIIRKCGSAVVESVTPEKYKSFLKTVFENRHGKTSSKESDAGDTEMMLADSSMKASGSMLEKRKHKAMSSIPEENGSVEQRKRKREKKNNAYARIPSSNEHHPSSGSGGGLRAVQSARLSHNAKSMKGQSEGRQKKSKRNHDQIMKNHEKRKEPTNTSKKDEATHIPNASKLSRHKVGRKRQKINK
nr:rrp12-like protein [Quercus suber]